MANEISVELEAQLKRLRAMGAKTVAFHDGQLAAVEFYPRELLDVGSIFPDADGDAAPTDRPPPMGEAEEDGPPLRVPRAIARILNKGSVS